MYVGVTIWDSFADAADSVGSWIERKWRELWGMNSSSAYNSQTITYNDINWDSGDKNHILRGTGHRGGHDWSPFGIDTNDPDAWSKLLPILKAAYEAG